MQILSVMAGALVNEDGQEANGSLDAVPESARRSRRCWCSSKSGLGPIGSLEISRRPSHAGSDPASERYARADHQGCDQVRSSGGAFTRALRTIYAAFVHEHQLYQIAAGGIGAWPPCGVAGLSWYGGALGSGRIANGTDSNSGLSARWAPDRFAC